MITVINIPHAKRLRKTRDKNRSIFVHYVVVLCKLFYVNKVYFYPELYLAQRQKKYTILRYTIRIPQDGVFRV